MNASVHKQLHVVMNTNKTNTPQLDLEHTVAKISSGVVIAFLTLLGNSISLVIFIKTKALRKRPYYLLVNLCIADVLVGASVALHVLRDACSLDVCRVNYAFMCFIFTLDYFSSLASIYLLSAVSVERLIAVACPFFHRLAGHVFYMIIIGVPWVLATVVIVMYTITYNIPLVSEKIFNDIYLLFIYLPVLVIFAAYASIIVKVRTSHIRGQNQNENQRWRDKKLAFTLLIVTLTSLITWLPYNCYYTLTYYCVGCVTYSNYIFYALIQLQYSNSLINIVVYAWRIPEFRKVLLRCTPWRGNRVGVVSSNNTRPRVSRTSQPHLQIRKNEASPL